jgi:hypothetical protein
MKRFTILLVLSLCLLSVYCQAYTSNGNDETSPPPDTPAVTETVERNFFYVASNEAPFSVVAGDDLVVKFTIANQRFLHPKNVTAYFSPCPEGWDCGYDTFSFNKTGIHPVELTIHVPLDANIDRYTLYILLDSYWRTARGVDRITVDVLPSDNVVPPPPVEENIPPYEPYEPIFEETIVEDNSAPEDIPLDSVTGYVVAPPVDENNTSNEGNGQGSSGNLLDYIIIGWVIVGVIVTAILLFRRK